MVNTYLDIRLKEEGGKKKIDKIFFCTNDGRREVSALEALCRNDDNSNKPEYINFGFSNLCYNYPYRIIIANECVPPSGEYEWYNGANFNLLYAYYRLTQMLGNSLPPRIDYNSRAFVRIIYRLSNVNGIEVLTFPRNVLTSDYNGTTPWSPTVEPSELLLFPLIFKKGLFYDSGSDSYPAFFSYNPPIGLSDNIGSATVSSTSWFYEGGELIQQYNEKIKKGTSSTATDIRFPIIALNSGHQIWNIDLDKLNIGYEVARYVESY